MSTKEERICSCGAKFTRWIRPEYDPCDYMCPECWKKDAWRFAMRMVQLNNKIRCVKCGWKLREKDCRDIGENFISFKCKCCGYYFELVVPEPSYDEY